MRIDLANAPQAIDAVGAGHADVAHDRVGFFLLQKAQSGLHSICRVDLIVRLQEHAQALARSHLVVDYEDVREFRCYGHNGPGRIKLGACRWREFMRVW